MYFIANEFIDLFFIWLNEHCYSRYEWRAEKEAVRLS